MTGFSRLSNQIRNSRRFWNYAPAVAFSSSTKVSFLILITFCGFLPFSGCRCLGPTSTCLRTNGPILRTTRRIRQGHLQRNGGQHRVASPEYYNAPTEEPYFNQHPNYRFLPVPGRDVFRGPASQTAIPSQAPYHNPDPNTSIRANEMPPGQYTVPPGSSTDTLPNLVPSQSPNSSPGTQIPGRSVSTQRTMRGTRPRANSQNTPLGNPLPSDHSIDLDPPPGYEQDNKSAFGDSAPQKTIAARTHNQLLKYPFRRKAMENISDWVHNVPVEVPTIDADRSSQNKSLHQNNNRSMNQILDHNDGRSNSASYNNRQRGERLYQTDFTPSNGKISQPGGSLDPNSPSNEFQTLRSVVLTSDLSQQQSVKPVHYQAILVPSKKNFEKKPNQNISNTNTNVASRPSRLPRIWPGSADPQIASPGSKNYVEIQKIEFGPKNHVVEVGQKLIESGRQQNLAAAGARTRNMFPYYPVTAKSHNMYQNYVPSIDSSGARRVATRNSKQNHTGIIVR